MDFSLSMIQENQPGLKTRDFKTSPSKVSALISDTQNVTCRELNVYTICTENIPVVVTLVAGYPPRLPHFMSLSAVK